MTKTTSTCVCGSSEKETLPVPEVTLDFLRGHDVDFYDSLSQEEFIALLGLDRVTKYGRSQLLAARVALALGETSSRGVGGAAEFIEDVLRHFSRIAIAPDDVRRILENFESTFDLAVTEANYMLADYPGCVTGVVED